MTPHRPTTARPTQRHRPGRALPVALALIAAVGLAVAAYWVYFHPKPADPTPDGPPAEGSFPPDPRLAYAGPFHNIRPDVGYVGDAKCAECHDDIARTYSRHPMGRSTVPVARFTGELPTDPAHHNPFEAFGIQFRVDRQGDRVFHRQTRPDSDGKPIYEF